MAKLTVKKLDIMSYAKINAAIGAIMGFFIGLMTAIASSLMVTVAGATGMPFATTGFGAMGVSAIIILPIVYAIMCFIGGAIGAFIYNMIAERIGGIQFET